MRGVLKVFGWIYILFAIFIAVCAVLTFTSPDYLNNIKESINVDIKDLDPKIFFGTVMGVAAILYFLIGMGLRNVANNKSKGTLILIFLILSAIGSIFTLINAINAANIISLALSLLMVYFVYSVRKQNN